MIKLASAEFPKLANVCTTVGCQVQFYYDGNGGNSKVDGCDAVRKACTGTSTCTFFSHSRKSC